MDDLGVEGGRDAQSGHQDVSHREIDQKIVAGVSRAPGAERTDDEEQVAEDSDNYGNDVESYPSPLVLVTDNVAYAGSVTCTGCITGGSAVTVNRVNIHERGDRTEDARLGAGREEVDAFALNFRKAAGLFDAEVVVHFFSLLLALSLGLFHFQ